MTLTKAELADMLFEKVGLNKREAKDMVETFFEEIRLALENGESVKLSGFGNFQLRNKPQRPGRDRKSTRLNSSHSQISYAVFCLKKKTQLTANGSISTRCPSA